MIASENVRLRKCSASYDSRDRTRDITQHDGKNAVTWLMRLNGVLRRPLWLVQRSIHTTHSGVNIKFSARERLLLLSSASFIGIAGWNRRNFHANTISIDYLPLPENPAVLRSRGQEHVVAGNDQQLTFAPDSRVIQEQGGNAEGAHSSQDTEVINRPPDGGHVLNDIIGQLQLDTTAARRKGGVTDVLAPTSTHQLYSYERITQHESREQAWARKHKDMGTLSMVSNGHRVLEMATAEEPNLQSRLPSGPRLTPFYFRRVQYKLKCRHHAEERRLQSRSVKLDDRDDHTAETWMSKVLAKLEKATPDGSRHFRKCVEIAGLPDGMRVVFARNAGETILEIMLRTGCHVQTLLGRRDSGIGFDRVDSRRQSNDNLKESSHGFDRLMLWGTPSQNAAAMKLLPNELRIISTANSEETGLRSNQLAVETTEDDYGVLDGFLGADSDPPMQLSKQMADMTADWKSPDVINTMKREVESDFSIASAPFRTCWSEGSPNALVRPSRIRGNSARFVGFPQPPPHWTPITFNNYVEDITRIVPSLLQRRATKDADGRNERRNAAAKHKAVELLLQAFRDVAAYDSVTSEAVNCAFQYLTKHEEYPALRQMLAALETNNKYSMTTHNYNVLLLSAAESSDAYQLLHWVEKMLRAGQQPSWGTWTSIYHLACRRGMDQAQRHRVLEVMQRKGILANTLAMQRVVEDSVEEDLRSFIERMQDDLTGTLRFGSFLDEYDQRYQLPSGHRFHDPTTNSARRYRPWLSVPTARIMIDVLLDFGMVDDAWSVIEVLEDSGWHANTMVMNTFLGAAVRARDPAFAIAVLKRFEPALARTENRVTLDETSYSMLFDIAWRRHHLNMLRVIWRYACCVGHASGLMRHKIWLSLVQYLPAPGSSGRRYREQRASGAASGEGEAEGSLAKTTKALRHNHEKSISENTVFIGWAGKFSIGVAEGLPPPGSLHPSIDMEPDLNARQLVESWGDRPSAVGSEVMRLASQPRFLGDTEPRGAHQARHEALEALFATDLSETLSLKPVVPLTTLLELAWRKDIEWKARGLGWKTVELERVAQAEHATEAEKTSAFAAVFGDMMKEGIGVPVNVGNGLERRGVFVA